MTHALAYIHRFLIRWVGIRLDFFVQMPTVTFIVHDFSVFVLVHGVIRLLLADDQCRVLRLVVIPKMRIRRLYALLLCGTLGITFTDSLLLRFALALEFRAVAALIIPLCHGQPLFRAFFPRVLACAHCALSLLPRGPFPPRVPLCVLFLLRSLSWRSVRLQTSA